MPIFNHHNKEKWSKESYKYKNKYSYKTPSKQIRICDFHPNQTKTKDGLPHWLSSWGMTKCLCHVISLTSPRDAYNFSLTAIRFRSVVDSDVMWQAFLPSDFVSILSRAVNPVMFTSKKDLFFKLSKNHVFIDRGTMVFFSFANFLMLKLIPLSNMWFLMKMIDSLIFVELWTRDI